LVVAECMAVDNNMAYTIAKLMLQGKLDDIDV
jgi:hypothetical protein